MILDLRECDIYVSRSYDYTHFIRLDNMVQIYGRYYVNFVVYTLAKQDVHILLAGNDANTSYEIRK